MLRALKIRCDDDRITVYPTLFLQHPRFAVCPRCNAHRKVNGSALLLQLVNLRKTAGKKLPTKNLSRNIHFSSCHFAFQVFIRCLDDISKIKKVKKKIKKYYKSNLEVITRVSLWGNFYRATLMLSILYRLLMRWAKWCVSGNFLISLFPERWLLRDQNNSRHGRIKVLLLIRFDSTHTADSNFLFNFCRLRSERDDKVHSLSRSEVRATQFSFFY